MTPALRTARRPSAHWLTGLVLALPLTLACAQSLPPATLGAHVLLGQEDNAGSSPAVTPAIDTRATGSSLIAFSAGFASNSRPPTDNKGNAWTALGPAVVYEGYDSRFDVKAFVSLGARGGAGHQVSIVKNGTAVGEITIPFVEVRDASILKDVARNYPGVGSAQTSGRVTTSGPAVLVAFWWGDGPYLDNIATPNNGFSIIENFVDLPPGSAVQCVVAVRTVAAAGTYDVTWSAAPLQGAPLWLFAFQGQGAIFANGFE